MSFFHGMTHSGHPMRRDGIGLEEVKVRLTESTENSRWVCQSPAQPNGWVKTPY